MDNRELGQTPETEVCAHKLFTPSQFKGAIRRDALLDRVFAEQAPRVILYQGPAGHGKSTLLQQSKATAEAHGALTGWLTFEDADNDLRRFYLHLQALVASVHRVEGLPDPPDMEEKGEAGLWRPVDWFINRLVGTEQTVSLFLDEFQQLTDRAILSFFREMLERMPDTVRIFIASRSVPEIGLARLVVNNQALVMRTEELRFSPTEVANFFATAPDLDMRADEVEAIYRQTEGWPAALQLFRLTLVRPSVRRSLGDLNAAQLPELAEYLADNVLVLQPREIQDFLRRTSPLTRLCAPLCDAVTGKHGCSQEVLLFLERSGLFVRSIEAEGCWFRYHSLFASFLQEQLRQFSQDATVEVHRRAMCWYVEHGLHDEAIYHAVAAREYAQAADIMDEWSSRLVSEGYLMTVERWYERLPLDEVEARPDLAVKVAWALTFLHRHAKVKPILEMLDRQEAQGRKPSVTEPQIIRAVAAILVDDLPRSFEAIRTVDIYGRDPEGFAAFELGAAANLRSFQALTVGDFDGARELLALGHSYSDRAGATFSLGYALANAGLTLIAQGELREALDFFRSGVSERIYLNESFASAALACCYTHALYEANEIDAAESQFREFKEVIAKATLLDYLAVAYLAISRIHDLRGRSGHASAVLDEAENIGFVNSLPRLVSIVNWERTRRLLLQGEVERARSLASRIRAANGGLPEEWVPFSEDTEGESIGRIRLAIHLGNADEGLRQIARQLALAHRTGRVRRQIKLHVLEVVAYAKKGMDVAARRCLRRALQLAQRGGMVRTFLDEGECVVRLLRQEYDGAHTGAGVGDAVPPEFMRKLLGVSGADQQQAGSVGRFEPIEPLTRREIDILVFLTSGVSNKEMARRISVSENTVKFHLKNIYSKLAVGSRLQAINAARRMGLI